MQSSCQKRVEVLADALDEHVLELLILEDIEALIDNCLLTLVNAFHHLVFIKISGQSKSDRIV